MIIQCPNCLTKFKLDDSKVSETGTRVRCTKCKEVFVAKKEIPTPPPAPSIPAPESAPKPAPASTPAPAAEKDEFDFSFGPSFGEEEKKAEEKEEPFQFGGGFGEEPKKEEEPFQFGGGFGEAPKQEEEEPFQFGGGFGEETPKQEEPFSFGGVEEEASRETPKEAQGEPFSFGMPSEEEAGSDKGKEQWGGMSFGEVSLPESNTEVMESPLGFDFKKEEETPFGEFEFKEEPTPAPVSTPGPSFEAPHAATIAHQPDVGLRTEIIQPPAAPGPVAHEESPGFHLEEEGFAEEFPTEFKQEERAPFLKKGILAILLAAVLSAGGWYFWSNYKSADSGMIALENMNGVYAQNAAAGNIFVISGRAVNNTNKARSFFQVKGILFNKKGDKLAQKEVYCGNIFSSKELITLPRAKIEADLMNKVGSSLSNINLSPGKSVPFMIVFFDLPADMAEFTVETTGSQLASE